MMSESSSLSATEFNPNDPLLNEAANTEMPPSKHWWWQRGVALMEGVAVVVAGLGFAAYFGLSGRPSDLAAGAAFGLALAIGIGGLFAVHDHWELLAALRRMAFALNEQKRIIVDREEEQRRDEQLRAVNAFYLGYQLAITLESTEDEDGFFFVRGLCQELNLPLWPDEWDRLERPPANSTELNAIVDMVRSRVQQSAPAAWWCFFRLGLTVFWLTQRLETRQSIVAVRRDLETISGDNALSRDKRFRRSVDQLLSILPTTLTLVDADRVNVAHQVTAILEGLPKGEPSFRIAPFAVPLTDWYWVQVGDIDGVAMRFIGSGHLTAYPGGRYDLEGLADRGSCVVRFENSDWSCSAHSEANGSQPCSDIELVYDLTDGGQPVTEARLRPVRLVEVEAKEEASAQIADSDGADGLSDEPEDEPE
jgi:hypothetical protein